MPSKLKKTLLIGGGLAVFGVILWAVAPSVIFSAIVGWSLREQRMQIEAVRPLLDSVITKKLKVGDTLDHAKRVLSDAGLEYTIAESPLPHMLQSGYRPGRWCAFTIQLSLDRDDRISKIDIHESFTAP